MPSTPAEAGGAEELDPPPAVKKLMEVVEAFTKAAQGAAADQAWFGEDDAYMEGSQGVNKRSLWSSLGASGGIG